MRKTSADFSIVLLVAIAFIVLSGVVFVYLSATARFDLLKRENPNDTILNTLFIIENKNKPLASYITLYYPLTRRAAIFDIPSDVGRIIKQINRVDRIDTIYDGQQLDDFVDQIEDLVAVDVNYTIALDLEALGKIVDLLDGIRLFIPASIEVYDGENSILFPSGWANLDGDKIRAYLTYEGEPDETEPARMRRQRFFIGLLKKLSEKNHYLSNAGVDVIMHSFIRTNMNRRTLMKLFSEWAHIDTDRTTIQIIAGNYREVSGQTLLIPQYDGNLIKDIVRQTQTALTRKGDRTLSDRIITVEVLNGTTVAGLAARTAELIRGFGYDVINVGNADRSDYEKTSVIDRMDHPQETGNFTGIIHCDNIIVDAVNQDDMDPGIQSYEYKADFTLIIGKDYNGRFN